MGMFDDIAGKAEGVLGRVGGEHQGIVKAVMEIFSSQQGGGLKGLIESFHQKGMGSIVSSWVGKGPNAPISADQLKEGMGRERLEAVAAKAGVSTEEAADQLSRHLPDVVDNLTPDGTVPEEGMLQRGLDLLKSKFS